MATGQILYLSVRSLTTPLLWSSHMVKQSFGHARLRYPLAALSASASVMSLLLLSHSLSPPNASINAYNILQFTYNFIANSGRSAGFIVLILCYRFGSSKKAAGKTHSPGLLAGPGISTYLACREPRLSGSGTCWYGVLAFLENMAGRT